MYATAGHEPLNTFDTPPPEAAFHNFGTAAGWRGRCPCGAGERGGTENAGGSQGTGMDGRWLTFGGMG